VNYQLRLRTSLGYEAASALERLLVDVILTAWQDYHPFAMVYGQRTGESFTLRDMEQELARVRRLLKLPALQVNIAAAGGQQVNVAGELSAGRSVPELPG
jgi:hypothetical protein